MFFAEDQLASFCDELIDVTENHKYLEIRHHPSYDSLLDDAGPLVGNEHFFSADPMIDLYIIFRRQRIKNFPD